MNEPSHFANIAANRIWNAAAGTNPSPVALAVRSSEFFARLRAGLGRWIGVSSFDTIFDRALGATREEFAWLANVRITGDTHDAMLAAAESFGVAEASEGGRALLGHTIELLGRIIGPEMAVHLVEHNGLPAQRSQRDTNTEKERDA